MRKSTLNLLFAAALAATSSFGANIVANGDFSNDHLGPWVSNTHVGYGWSSTGSNTVTTGCVGSSCVNNAQLTAANYLYQDLATVTGANYTLSFDFASGSGTPSELKILWGNNVVLDLVNAAATMTGYSVSNLIATSGSSRLTFLGRQDPGYLALTNVDVERSSAPEPASIGMICGGIGLVGFVKRMRKNRGTK
jgi:hypothetical protein